MDISTDASKQEVRALADLLHLLGVDSDEVEVSFVHNTGHIKFEHEEAEGIVRKPHYNHSKGRLEGGKWIECFWDGILSTNGKRLPMTISYDTDGLNRSSEAVLSIVKALWEREDHDPDALSEIQNRLDTVFSE